MTKSPFINFHTHRPRTEAGLIEIHAPIKNEIPSPPFVRGLHPWYLKEFNDLELLKSQLQQEGCIGLGEIGLDRSIDMDLSIQLEFYEKQIQLAIDLSINLIVLHCVKAFDQIMKPLKNYQGKIIFHDYNGSPGQTLELLKDQRVFFSFGHFLTKEKSKAFRSIENLPMEKILLETDEREEKIEFFYELLAKKKSLPLEEVKEILFKTYSSFLI